MGGESAVSPVLYHHRQYTQTVQCVAVAKKAFFVVAANAAALASRASDRSAEFVGKTRPFHRLALYPRANADVIK